MEAWIPWICGATEAGGKAPVLLLPEFIRARAPEVYVMQMMMIQNTVKRWLVEASCFELSKALTKVRFWSNGYLRWKIDLVHTIWKADLYLHTDREVCETVDEFSLTLFSCVFKFSDYQNYIVNRCVKENPTMERSIALCNGISQWVQLMVLSRPTPQLRAEVFIKFIHVAQVS